MILKRIHDTSRYSMNMLTPNLSVRAFLEKTVEKQLQLCWGRLAVYNAPLTSSGYLTTKEIMALVSVAGPNFRRIHITETELQQAENPSLLYFYTSHLKYSLFWFLCVFCNVILITQQKSSYKILFSLINSLLTEIPTSFKAFRNTTRGPAYNGKASPNLPSLGCRSWGDTTCMQEFHHEHVSNAREKLFKRHLFWFVIKLHCYKYAKHM